MKTTKLLLFLAVICTACSQKSDTPEPVIDPVTSRLEAANFYYIDQSLYKVSYDYNAAGLLQKESQLLADGKPLLVIDYKYEDNLLTEQRISGNPKVTAFTYKYKKDTLLSAEYKDFQLAPDHLHFTRAYSYPEKGIVKIVEHDVLEKTVQHIYLFIQNGNIVRTKTLDPITDQVKAETVLEYDDHPNPYYQLTGKSDLSKFNSRNNVKAVKTLFQNGASVNSEVTYTYEYTTGGLPLKKHQVLINNKKLLEQEYIYSNP